MFLVVRIRQLKTYVVYVCVIMNGDGIYVCMFVALYMYMQVHIIS